jgi:hypothetical protein
LRHGTAFERAQILTGAPAALVGGVDGGHAGELTCVRHRLTLCGEVRWAEEDADCIRTRSSRYPGALDIAPEWTQEVLADERLVELSPYPTSRVGASGFIGWSDSARRVLVVIAYRDLDGDLHGLNAWSASGRDLVTYNEAVE